MYKHRKGVVDKGAKKLRSLSNGSRLVENFETDKRWEMWLRAIDQGRLGNRLSIYLKERFLASWDTGLKQGLSAEHLMTSGLLTKIVGK